MASSSKFHIILRKKNYSHRCMTLVPVRKSIGGIANLRPLFASKLRIKMIIT